MVRASSMDTAVREDLTSVMVEQVDADEVPKLTEQNVPVPTSQLTYNQSRLFMPHQYQPFIYSDKPWCLWSPPNGLRWITILISLPFFPLPMVDAR